MSEKKEALPSKRKQLEEEFDSEEEVPQKKILKQSDASKSKHESEEEEEEEEEEDEEEQEKDEEEEEESEGEAQPNKTEKPIEKKSSAASDEEGSDGISEDELEILDTSAIIPGGRRTRGVRIDYKQFGADPEGEE